MRFFHLILIVFALAMGALLLRLVFPAEPDLREGQTATVTIAGHEARAKVAATTQSRTKGLAGAAHLAEGEGMLFVFDRADTHSFWMKGMLIPIDIIWIHEDQVVDVRTNVPILEGSPSDAEIPTFAPSAPAKFVLEVPAGWADRHGVKTGSAVTIR